MTDTTFDEYTRDEWERPVIGDCGCTECGGECGQLTEDGELCQLCRVGLHGEDA